MKVISVLVFAIAMASTWYLAHANKPVAESVHVGIQTDLKKIITEYVQQNLPNSKSLKFERMWTETLKKDRVRANFIYSFEDVDDKGDAVVLEISGAALLNKAGETPEMVTWNLDELQISDNKVTFTEPIQISAGAGDLEKSSEPASQAPMGAPATQPADAPTEAH